jgi:AraC-like DNA-binding protein
LHFLPVLIVVLLSLPYTSLPFKEKFLVAHKILGLATLYNPTIDAYNIGLLFYFRGVFKFIYTIFILFYFRKLSKEFDLKWGKDSEDKKSFQTWIYFLISSQLLIAVIALGSVVTIPGLISLKVNEYILHYKEGLFRLTGFLVFTQNFMLFLFPKILFGKLNTIGYKFEKSFVDNLTISVKKKHNDILVNEQIDTFLESYLPQKTYLQKNFNKTQLSFDLNISERVLTNYFNAYLFISFSVWKNKLRIDEALKLMDEANFKNYTIEGIGEIVGFQSRTNFIKVFKEYAGVSPSDYIKKLLK